MSESLYSPNQKVLSNQGKENWDRIRWDETIKRMEKRIEKYFSDVSDEQLQRDLKEVM